MKLLKRYGSLLTCILMLIFVCGCGQTEQKTTNLQPAPIPKELLSVNLPMEVTSNPPIESAYRIAATVPQVLEQIKCYCACVSKGTHMSLKECFIEPGGNFNVRYLTRHSPLECSGVSCNLCVLEAREAWALLQQGKSVAEIREYIDKNYGPSQRSARKEGTE